MLKVSTLTLIQTEGALVELANVDMDSTGSLLIATALIKVKESLKPINEVRQKLAKSHCRYVKKQDENGKDTEEDSDKPLTHPDNKDAIILNEDGKTKMEALFKEEVEFPMDKIPYSSFGKCKIKAAVVVDLDWLISR